MSKRVRILLVVLVAVIALYFVISQPDHAAEVVRSIVRMLGSAVESIVRFGRQLFA